MNYRTTLAALLAGVALMVTGNPKRVAAQGIGGRLKRAAAEAAARKAEERADAAAADATDTAINGAAKAAKDTKGTKGADARGTDRGTVTGSSACKSKSCPPAATATLDSNDAEPRATQPTARGVDAGKDFVAGTRVLLSTDFTRDELGDFPRAFRLRGGNIAVVEISGRRYLRANSFGAFEIPLAEDLPERFTMEFDFTGSDGWHQELRFDGKPGDAAGYRVALRPEDGGIYGPADYNVTAQPSGTREGEPFRVQIMADGDYVKVYMNGTRVANAPNAALGRSRVLRFTLSADPDAPVLIGNLRIAAGGKDLYAALSSSGRVTADGILFDTNVDRIRPESAPVLREIADMMAAHPEMQLTIEGHTDDVGGATHNQALSTRRALAVQRYLVDVHGVMPARLQAVGFGSTRPVAANDSEPGRQRNRRVELVKR